MTSNRIALPDRTSSLLANGATAIVIPIKPRDGLVYSRDFKPPCQPGKPLYLLETMNKWPCRRVWKDWTVEAVQIRMIPKEYIKKIGIKSSEGDTYFHYYFKYINETYPHLNMDTWVWYIEKVKN